MLSPRGLPDRFLVDAGHASFEAADAAGTLVRHPLVEVDPGLFLADNGEMLDLRDPATPTWQDLRLVPVAGSPSGWQWALLGAAAITAATWLLTAGARTRRRHHHPSPPARDRAVVRRWRPITGGIAALTALLALGTIVLVAAVPGLVDSGFLGWLALPVTLRLTLHLPLALALASLATVALVTWGWVGDWWPRGVRLEYTALAIAAVTVAAQMAAWQLIGCGYT